MPTLDRCGTIRGRHRGPRQARSTDWSTAIRVSARWYTMIPTSFVLLSASASSGRLRSGRCASIMRCPSRRVSTTSYSNSSLAAGLRFDIQLQNMLRQGPAAHAVGRARSATPLEAVDGEMLSGHEDVRIGSKISNEAGDVLRHADPAHGDSRYQLRFAALDQIPQQVGCNHARTDRVDRDLRSELLGERACQPEDAGFGGSIGVLADGTGDPARQGVQRRHGNDPSAFFLGQHGGCGGVDKIEAAFQGDSDGAIELMFGGFGDW